jgi:hypothetical protein
VTWAGVWSVVVEIVDPSRAGCQVTGGIDAVGRVDKSEGGSEGSEPGNAPEIAVVGINVHPTTQRQDQSAAASVPIRGSTAKCGIHCAPQSGSAHFRRIRNRPSIGCPSQAQVM